VFWGGGAWNHAREEPATLAPLLRVVLAHAPRLEKFTQSVAFDGKAFTHVWAVACRDDGLDDRLTRAAYLCRSARSDRHDVQVQAQRGWSVRVWLGRNRLQLVAPCWPPTISMSIMECEWFWPCIPAGLHDRSRCHLEWRQGVLRVVLS
jgi:hypothetical protein